MLPAAPLREPYSPTIAKGASGSDLDSVESVSNLRNIPGLEAQ